MTFIAPTHQMKSSASSRFDLLKWKPISLVLAERLIINYLIIN
jgi:hypothetical protein